jgi:hypothetical protein
MNKKMPRHWTPHSKGLRTPAMPIRFADPAKWEMLKDRARYETMHYRLEHKGKGKVISPADIVRRLIDDYLAKVSPIPDDAIGAALRATKTKP